MAVDQKGAHGNPFWQSGGQGAWGRRRPEANERYLGVFNGGDRPANIRVDWGALKLAERCTLRDLWGKTDVGVIRGGYTSRCLPRIGTLRVTASK